MSENLQEIKQVEEIIPAAKVKITSYLCYFAAVLAGAAYPVCGLVSPQIAKHFDVLTANIVFIDVLVMVGLILGNSLSGKIIEKLGGRKTLALAGAIYVVDQLVIGMQNSLYVYGACVLLAGFAMGLIVPAVSYLIVAAFSPRDESEGKLSVLNFFFGIGGFLGPSIAGMIVYHTSWRVAFVFTAAAFLLMGLAAYFVKNDEKLVNRAGKKEQELAKDEGKNYKAITAGVVLVGLALIAYVYTEYVITYWFSPYLQESLGYNVSHVGFIIGIYWLSVAVGRFIFGEFVIPKVKDHVFIISAVLVVIVGFFLFINVHNLTAIFIIVALLGLACSSIFPTLLGYGMKQTAAISPITMAFLVCSGSVGGGLSLLVSGTVGVYLPKVYAIYMGPVCCLFIILFVLLSKRLKKV